MKKAISFAVALGLVAGAACVASAADLTITGDARWRGVYKTNGTDFNDANQDKEQKMDQRYRLKADVKVNDDVTINTRFVIGDNEFGNATTDPDTGVTSSNPLTLSVDTADMSIKTLGGTWTIGRQNISWGNEPLPFLVQDTPLDWISGAYAAGGITIVPYLQKDVEGNYANGDGDTNTYGTLLMGKAGDTGWGVLLNYSKSNNNITKANGKDTGYIIDPYINTKIGPVTLLSEISYLSGDLYKRNDSAQYGGYVAGVVGLDPVTLTGLVAYSKNGYTATSYFQPSLLIGTQQDTAIIDFGQTAADTDSGDNSYLVGAVASVKASDKLKFGALLGYLGATKHGVGDNKGTLLEVDLTAEYELAKNATYKFGIGYGDPKHLSMADDAVIVVGNAVEVKW